jgi:hypothetical protein
MKSLNFRDMSKRLLLAIIGCASLVAAAQTPDRGTDLVTVTASVDHKVLQAGQDLRVSVTLTAGPKGAWLPNHFSEFLETCQSGFSADIFTLDGKRASDSNKGCGGSWLFGNFIPSEELKHYVFLQPGETRTWHTTIKEITRTPGTYKVLAEYLSAWNRIQEAAELPEVHGLMVMGHVSAKPIPVRIR